MPLDYESKSLYTKVVAIDSHQRGHTIANHNLSTCCDQWSGVLPLVEIGMAKACGESNKRVLLDV